MHDAKTHLAGNLRLRHTVAVEFNDESLDVVIVDVAGEHHSEIGEGAAADPAFGTSDQPTVLGALSGGCQAAGDIGTVVRLGQREAADLGEVA